MSNTDPISAANNLLKMVAAQQTQMAAKFAKAALADRIGAAAAAKQDVFLRSSAADPSLTTYGANGQLKV